VTPGPDMPGSFPTAKLNILLRLSIPVSYPYLVAQTMTKRRVSSEDFSSDDEQTATSPVRKPTKTPKTKRQPAKKKPKATIAKEDSPEKTDEETDSYSWPHASSTHTISSPKPLRVPLLEWYVRVHDMRGMPWRKPYDSSLGRDRRAQRAYEVCIFFL